jgi:hypothetical protein
MYICCINQAVKTYRMNDPKVLDTFIFVISSKCMGEQKKYYCQIKAEILKFMWVFSKRLFWQKKITTEHQNVKLVIFFTAFP